MKIGTIKHIDLKSSVRFDGGFHLSESVIFEKKIKKMDFKILDELVDKIFTAGRSKRIYTEKEFGFPYLSNSDVAKNNPFESCKYNSIKYAYDEPSFLKEGMIVTGRVGAIGQTAYINSELEKMKAMGSDNIIRIVAKDKDKSGYIYSYLVSKYGNTFFHKIASGGVQPYISEDQVKDIPVPILPEEKQQQIHQLIVDSANLRVEANKLLKEAQSTLISKLDLEESVNTNISNSIKLSTIKRSHQVRFESSFYTSKGSKLKETIVNQNDCILLGELSERIFRPGIFKRNYVSNGIDFLGGSDITKSIPDSEKKLSPTKTSNINELKLEEDWILVTCGGTIGTSVYVNNYLSKKLASQHILRVVPNKVLTGYLFAFLSSDVGIEIVKSFTYGSVIPQIEPHHLEKIPIPILDEKLMEEINLNVISYKNKIDEAILKENQAINLIEKEIDAWQ